MKADQQEHDISKDATAQVIKKGGEVLVDYISGDN